MSSTPAGSVAHSKLPVVVTNMRSVVDVCSYKHLLLIAEKKCSLYFLVFDFLYGYRNRS